MELHGSPPPRGDETRADLIEAGLVLFGAQGFESVSTRALAREAGVNLAAIGYHFGGKQGLYEAVTRSVVDELRQELLPNAQRLGPALAAAVDDPERFGKLTAELLRAILFAFLGQQRRRLHIAFVLREYLMPSDAFPILFDGLVGPMHKVVTALVATAKRLPPEHPQAILGAHALVGQCAGFAIARAPLLRRMQWDEITPQRIDEIAAVVVPMALASLGLEPGEDT